MINNDSKLTAAFWEKGRLDDCPIYDFHAHMGPLGTMYFPAGEPEDMIKTMKRCNTALTVFCSHISMKYPDWEEYNLNAALKYPEYFKAYHAVIPGRTDYKTAIERFEKYPGSYFGFKFHPDSNSTPLTDKLYAPFLAYMNAHKLPALVHTWGHSPYDGVDVIAKAAGMYPDAIFICGHSFHGDWVNGAKKSAECPNLFYELTAVLDNYGALEILCEYAGSEKVLFGTDLPWFDTHHGIGAVLSADITDGDRRNIFYENGLKLLKKVHLSSGRGI